MQIRMGGLEGDRVWVTSDSKLLRIAIENLMKFNKHVSNLCSTAIKKLSVLTIMIYLDSLKRVLVKAFLEFQFKFCPLVWMFDSCQLN